MPTGDFPCPTCGNPYGHPVGEVCPIFTQFLMPVGGGPLGSHKAICPDCMGCGKISYDQMGRPVPQPTFASDVSDPPEWLTCQRCHGSGLLVSGQN